MANLTAVERIPLAKIAPNPNNPRADFDEEKLRALADSFAANGGRPFTPLLVVRDGGRYMIVDGERRYRAMCLVGEVEDADVVVADDAEAAYAMAAMLATDSKEKLTDVERAVGTQQMLMLGVEPEVVDKTAGLKHGRARTVKALVEDRDEPVQVSMGTLFRIADIDDALEREQLMDMAADGDEDRSWDSPLAKRLNSAESAQRSRRQAAELAEWLDEHGIAYTEEEPEGMTYARSWGVYSLDGLDPAELAGDGAVVQLQRDGYAVAIKLFMPLEGETDGQRAEREELERRNMARQEYAAEMGRAAEGRFEFIYKWLGGKHVGGELAGLLLDLACDSSAYSSVSEQFEWFRLFQSDLTPMALLAVGYAPIDNAAYAGAWAYSSRVIDNGGSANEVRKWLDFLHALTEAGYEPTDFEVRAKTVLTGLLKAWDAGHAEDGEAAD